MQHRGGGLALAAVLALALPLVLGAGPALAKPGGVPAHQYQDNDNPGGPPPGRPAGPPHKKRHEAPPPEVQRGGPPPRGQYAPAHQPQRVAPPAKRQVKHHPWSPPPGQAKKYHYRYYASQNVYFDPGRGMWFWLEGQEWRMGAELPGWLRVGSSFVTLTMGVDQPYRYHPQVVAVYPGGPKAQTGPPPWAPAHGHRAKYKYRYYPANQVYFDPGRGLWFWLEAGNWRLGAELPAGTRLGGSFVTLSMEAEQPYQYHPEVRRYYPGR